MRILLVEDEIPLALAVSEVLKKQNYIVDIVHDGNEAFDYALSNIYDVIILDILLPKLNGIEVLGKLRNENIKTPILLLTALSQIEDKILGLDSGADDYLTKPFEMDELMARIRALLRRLNTNFTEDLMYYGDITLIPHKLQLKSKNDLFILTKKEFQLIEYLILNKGVILSTDTIIEKIWGFDSDVVDNNVQAYISFLRKKLKLLKTNVTIKNIRGAGYTLYGEE